MEEEFFKNLEKSNFVQGKNLIEEKLPGWLISIADNYSDDYLHFQKNWQLICEKINISPEKIILVRDINFNENSLQMKICEYLTRKGYCVRRNSEFISCPVCQCLIPCEDIYNKLKSIGVKLPQQWKNKCSTC